MAFERGRHSLSLSMRQARPTPFPAWVAPTCHVSRWTGKEQSGHRRQGAPLRAHSPYPTPPRCDARPAICSRPTLNPTRTRQVSRWTGKEQAGYLRQVMPLRDGGGGALDVELEWLP